MDPNEQSELVFYIRHQNGFTAKLYQAALAQPENFVPVLVDGPYGGINAQRFHEGDHLLVVAGGSGAGWMLPFIERFVRQSSISSDEEQGVALTSSKESDSNESKECCPPKTLTGRSNNGALSLRVVLATRDIASRVWFLKTVSELLARYPSAESNNIKVQVFLTGEAAQEAHLPPQKGPTENTSARGSTSNSSVDQIDIPSSNHATTVPGKEFEGRPELASIVKEEADQVAESGRNLSVFVCGPDTMLNDVRNAVAEENLGILKGVKRGGVYLHSEHFSWA